jgi:hypothetical protein
MSEQVTDWMRVDRRVPRGDVLLLRSADRPDLGKYRGALYPDREDHRIGYWMEPDGRRAVVSPTHWKPLL